MDILQITLLLKMQLIMRRMQLKIVIEDTTQKAFMMLTNNWLMSLLQLKMVMMLLNNTRDTHKMLR